MMMRYKKAPSKSDRAATKRKLKKLTPRQQIRQLKNEINELRASLHYERNKIHYIYPASPPGRD